jgi:DNA polymerase III alpha subunit
VRSHNFIDKKLQATGSEGLGMQMAMSDLVSELMPYYEHSGHHEGPKILGMRTLRVDVPDMEDYTPVEKLQLEREVLGLTVSQNEMELHQEALLEQGVILSKDLALARYSGSEVLVAGIVVAGRRHMRKDGEYMLFITIQDAKGLIEVVLFPGAYKEHCTMLANEGYGPYLIKGQVQVSGKGRSIGVQPPSNLRATDAVSMKMHPVVIASSIRAWLP